MKGLELAKQYYEEFGLPMLKESFSDVFDKLAIGFAGHGSECFGFDDEISLDHDFEPSFCIWITKEDEEKFGFKLFRAYSKLPKEYKGFKIQDVSAFGSDTKGVHTINDFYSFYIGNKLPETNKEWLAIPDYYLAEATNGEVFIDNLGEFSRIRNYLLTQRPVDVRLKKLASEIFYMAQYGQYNYLRAFKHGEMAAASLCLNEFAKHTAQAIYLLNNKYSPYYKWLFKGLDKVEKLGNLKNEIERLVKDPLNIEINVTIIENICLEIEKEIRNQNFSTKTDSYLEPYAYCINNCIKDSEIRNMPVML